MNYRYYNIKWFKRMAPIYDIAELFISGIRKKTSNIIPLPNKAKILDVACGTGSQSIAFAKKGFSVTGIDLSPNMLARAKKKIKPDYKINFLCQDATKIPYSNSYFDAATISFGLHDMPKKVAIKILREMQRATKPNGKIIIVDYHKPKNILIKIIAKSIAKTWESKHYDAFMKNGLEKYLGIAGLKKIKEQKCLLGNIGVVVCNNHKKRN